MGYVFTPPTAEMDPPYLPDSSREQKRLYRHMTARPVGLNVFKLSDGTFVTSLESVPYPWNPNDPSGPYSRMLVFGQPEVDVSLPVWIVAVYWGGHENPITDAEQAELVAAGYGSYITGTP